MHQALGFAHATLYHHLRRLAGDQRGQGTVEYVGLILLIAGIMVAIVGLNTKAGQDLGNTIVDKLKGSIDGVGNPPKAK